MNTDVIKEYVIRGQKYQIRKYACSSNTRFPFYINITNRCNASCPFCCNGGNRDYRKLDLDYLKEIFEIVSPDISRISISGGETLIDSKQMDELLTLLDPYQISTTINTNGSFLLTNIPMLNSHRLQAIILSRHHYDDEKNNEIFHLDTLGIEKIHKMGLKTNIRFNCLLIKGYIDSYDEVTKYLEMVCDKSDAYQVGFISMMGVNKFAQDKFVDYRDIIKKLDDRFEPTGYKCDGERCSCANYFYTSSKGKRIFVYFRYTKEYGCSGRSLFFDCTGLKEGY